MHHATKKSAVEKYSPLLLAHASKEEIIAAILKMIKNLILKKLKKFIIVL